MINKKAETRTVLVPLLLAVFILIIAYLLLFTGAGKNILERIGILTPTFNQTHPGAKDPEIFRYDLQQNVVEFYDSTEWLPFDTIILNEKTFSSDKIYDDLTHNYYYNKSLRETKKIPVSSIYRKIYPDAQGYCIFISDILSGKGTNTNIGDMQVTLLEGEIADGKRTCTNKILGWFDFTRTGSLQFTKSQEPNSGQPVSESSDIYNEIVPILVDWRDSIFLRPVAISYTKDSQKLTAYACAKIESNRYLQTILEDQTKGSGETC